MKGANIFGTERIVDIKLSNNFNFRRERKGSTPCPAWNDYHLLPGAVGQTGGIHPEEKMWTEYNFFSHWLISLLSKADIKETNMWTRDNQPIASRTDSSSFERQIRGSVGTAAVSTLIFFFSFHLWKLYLETRKNVSVYFSVFHPENAHRWTRVTMSHR